MRYLTYHVYTVPNKETANWGNIWMILALKSTKYWSFSRKWWTIHHIGPTILSFLASGLLPCLQLQFSFIWMPLVEQMDKSRDPIATKQSPQTHANTNCVGFSGCKLEDLTVWPHCVTSLEPWLGFGESSPKWRNFHALSRSVKLMSQGMVVFKETTRGILEELWSVRIHHKTNNHLLGLSFQLDEE